MQSRSTRSRQDARRRPSSSLRLLTFCTKDLDACARAIHDAARAAGIVVHHFENEVWLPVCRRHYPHLLRPPDDNWGQGEKDRAAKVRRSAAHGWYGWKAWALCQVLDDCADGSLLLYTDVDTRRYPLIIETFTDTDVRAACEEMLAALGDFACPTNNVFRQGAMCKRLCLEAMGADSAPYRDALQNQTSWFVCRVGPQARRIAREWLRWSVDPRGLSTGEPSPGGEHSQFVVHRHDQAVLTNVLLRELHEGRLPTPRPYANARYLSATIAEHRGLPYDMRERLLRLARRGDAFAVERVLLNAWATPGDRASAVRGAVAQLVEGVEDGSRRTSVVEAVRRALHGAPPEVVGAASTVLNR